MEQNTGKKELGGGKGDGDRGGIWRSTARCHGTQNSFKSRSKVPSHTRGRSGPSVFLLLLLLLQAPGTLPPPCRLGGVVGL